MLPNKQYFYISAIVPGSKLHSIMSMFNTIKAYNVEVKAFEEKEEIKEQGTRRDLTEIKQQIVELLTKKGPMRASEIFKAIGVKYNTGLIYRMVNSKQIKKGAKGQFKV